MSEGREKKTKSKQKKEISIYNGILMSHWSSSTNKQTSQTASNNTKI